MLFFSAGISGEVGDEAIRYRKLVCSQKECREKQIRLQACALVSEAPIAAHFPTQALAIKSQFCELTSWSPLFLFILRSFGEYLFSQTGNLWLFHQDAAHRPFHRSPLYPLRGRHSVSGAVLLAMCSSHGPSPSLSQLPFHISTLSSQKVGLSYASHIASVGSWKAGSKYWFAYFLFSSTASLISTKYAV